MSIQSESGRKDYSDSDHAPSQRMAMDKPANDNDPYFRKALEGQLDSMEAGAAGKGGGTNVIPEIIMDMARRNKK